MTDLVDDPGQPPVHHSAFPWGTHAPCGGLYFSYRISTGPAQEVFSDRFKQGQPLDRGRYYDDIVWECRVKG